MAQRTFCWPRRSLVGKDNRTYMQQARRKIWPSIWEEANMERLNITLTDENMHFLQECGAADFSSYINNLLSKSRMSHMKEKVLRANFEEATDAEYQEALADWTGASSLE